MSTGRLLRRTGFAAALQDMGGLFPALALGGVGVGTILYLASAGNKPLVVAGGGLAYLIGAFLSGNARLFSFWALMAAIPFDLSKRFGPYIAKMGGEHSFRAELSDPFLLVLAAFLVRDVCREGGEKLRIPKVTWIWLSIALFGCAGVAMGPWRITGAHEIFRMLKVTLLFIVVCNELLRPNRVFHCAAALTLGLVVQAIVGLAQYKMRKHFGLSILGETGAGTIEQLASDSISTVRAFRAGGFMNHPNIFGIFLAAVLPVTIGAYVSGTGRGSRLFHVSGAMLGMGALITTMSRSGWVSFAAAFTVLLLLLLLHPGLRRRSLLATGAAGAALLVVCVVFARPIIVRITESKESAMISRSEYVETAVGLIKEKPVLGWGLNSYAYVAPGFTRYGVRGAAEKFKGTKQNPGFWLPPVHNIYLLWWVETGAVGLALHLAAWGGIIGIAVRNLRARDSGLYAMNAACLCGMIAFMVDGLFSFSLRINSILRVFWVLAAMIMAIHYLRSRDSEQ